MSVEKNVLLNGTAMDANPHRAPIAGYLKG